MKKKFRFVCLSLLVLFGSSAYSQKAGTPADTIKLSKEYVQVSKEIADLSSQLSVAKSNLAAYRRSIKSSVTDSIIAKAKAAKAIDENPQSVNRQLNKQHDNITILSSEIDKKQRRLQELHAERNVL